MMQKDIPKQFLCSKCSKNMSLEEFKKHDCIGMKTNRRTIRLPSKYG